MMLRFRNVEATPEDPVENWGTEGLLAAIERGELTHWRRVAAAVRRDPWGPVASRLAEMPALAESEGSVGVATVLLLVVERARREAEQHEKEVVAAELRELVAATGLTQGAFAARLGTARSRLNSYLTGKVTPAATVMVRARRIAARR
jgi:DNA-binding transcriptional regulator YiaG